MKVMLNEFLKVDDEIWEDRRWFLLYGRIFAKRKLMMTCRRAAGGSRFKRMSTRRRLMMKRRRTAGGSRFIRMSTRRRLMKKV